MAELSALEKLEALRTSIDKLKADRQTTVVRIGDGLKRIDERFGVQTLDAAEGLLKKRQLKADTLQRSLDAGLAELQTQWEW